MHNYFQEFTFNFDEKHNYSKGFYILWYAECACETCVMILCARHADSHVFKGACKSCTALSNGYVMKIIF